MKRVLLVLLSIVATIALTACGDNTTEEPKESAAVETSSEPEEVETESEETEAEVEAETEVEEFIEENDVQLDEDGFFVETSDPLEAGDKTNGIVVFNDELDYTYIVKEWYTNEDTGDDGFNHIDFDGYKVKFAVTLIENTDQSDSIGIFIESENGLDDEVNFGMSTEIITDDTQEQAYTDSMYGVGDSKPGIKNKGFTKIDIEYEAPESFTAIISPPLKKTGESSYEEGHYGEPIELEFNKE